MNNEHEQPHLHIFVNRRRFETGDGVKPNMTGGEIAALIDLAPENAVVRWSSGPHDNEEIAINQPIKVKNGDHFLVTRKVVEGGHGTRARFT